MAALSTEFTPGHVALRRKHQATVGDEGAKIVVFRVHTWGKPWRYLDHEK